MISYDYFSFLIQILRLFSNSTSTSTTSTSVSTRCTIYIYIWYISQYTLTRFLFPQFQQKCFSFWLKRVLGLVNCYTGISVIHKHTHTRTPRKNIEIQLSLSNLLFDSLRLFISLSLSVLHSQLFYCYTVYMIFCSFEFVREFPHSFYIYKYTRFFVTV